MIFDRAQNICARVPRQKPSAGMIGEDCSQPPDGVAAIMLPSMVDDVEMHGVAAHRAARARLRRRHGRSGCRRPSARPRRRRVTAARAPVGDPHVEGLAAALDHAGHAARCEAVAPISLRRASDCRRPTAALRAARRRRRDRRRNVSRSAKASLAASVYRWTKSGPVDDRAVEIKAFEQRELLQRRDALRTRRPASARCSVPYS